MSHHEDEGSALKVDTNTKMSEEEGSALES
jgi:hypothetical protein